MNKLFTESIRGYSIEFNIKPGVFSPRGLDSGTKLLLDKIQVTNGTLIADLGCGVGVIGLLVAKLNPDGHVHLIDDHLRSVNLAQENIELNKLRNAEVYLSDLFSELDKRTYHQIVCNPSAQMGNEFLEEIIEESYKHLKPRGWLWLVIKNNLKSVIEKMLQSSFKNYAIIAHGKEHIVLKSQKKN